MIRQLIDKVVNHKNLTQDEAMQAMALIMQGEATPAQVSAYITALRMKGETVEEITGSVLSMRAASATIDVKGQVIDVGSDDAVLSLETIVDTCGTGGDCTNTFNISTAVSFVVAACGLTVAKHGNRSVSSKSGSADVLEALGVKIGLEPEQVKSCIEQVGIGFLFAPQFHPAMKHAIGPRREIGIRTLFNILGPLCNPANANAQVLGVYDEQLTEKLAGVLLKIGLKRAMIVHGAGGLDEVSILGSTKISRIVDNGTRISTFNLNPEEAGLQVAKLEDIQGGTAEENAEILNDIFNGKQGPKTDAVLINTAAVLVVAGKTTDFKKGVEMAREVLLSGEAKSKLAQLKEVTQKLG